MLLTGGGGGGGLTINNIMIKANDGTAIQGNYGGACNADTNRKAGIGGSGFGGGGGGGSVSLLW